MTRSQILKTSSLDNASRVEKSNVMSRPLWLRVPAFTVTLAKKPEAHKPAKKIEVEAA